MFISQDLDDLHDHFVVHRSNNLALRSKVLRSALKTIYDATRSATAQLTHTMNRGYFKFLMVSVYSQSLWMLFDRFPWYLTMTSQTARKSQSA